MITLEGNPQSTNHVYAINCASGRPRNYMNAKGKALKEDYMWQVKSQWKKKPLKSDVAVNIILYFGDNRKRDIDNYFKLSLDACNGIVWEDDSQIVEMSVIKQKDKLNPRIEIYVA